VGVGLYYSVGEWRHPGYLAVRRRTRAGGGSLSLRACATARTDDELRRIDYLFYDGCPPPRRGGRGHQRRDRRLQPHILISNRCGLNEDVPSAEQEAMADPARCGNAATHERQLGLQLGHHNWKTAYQLVRMLLIACHNVAIPAERRTEGGRFDPGGVGASPAPDRGVDAA